MIIVESYELLMSSGSADDVGWLPPFGSSAVSCRCQIFLNTFSLQMCA